MGPPCLELAVEVEDQRVAGDRLLGRGIHATVVGDAHDAPVDPDLHAHEREERVGDVALGVGPLEVAARAVRNLELVREPSLDAEDRQATRALGGGVLQHGDETLA
ncbi:MAG: hypothetical protein UT02_C0041G0002 [Parcubacteria group bacterium GW2011_GWC2_38_7]|nr:MAG: hypothetical protein UT02_C0041G0002 [Parcubacteria group bacterium GW2011_GWC2_38_7]